MSSLSQAAKSLCAKTGIKHQQALDVVAQAMGYRDYNVYLGSRKKAMLPQDISALQSVVGGVPVSSMNKFISVLQGSRQAASVQDIVREIWSPSTFRFLYEFFRARNGSWPDFRKYYKPFTWASPTALTDSFMVIPEGIAEASGETAPPWSPEIEKMAHDFVSDCVGIDYRDNMVRYVPYRSCHVNIQRIMLPVYGVFPKDVSAFYEKNPSKKKYLADQRYLKIAPVVELTIALMVSVTSIGFSIDERESLFSQAAFRAEVNALRETPPSAGKIVSFSFDDIDQIIEEDTHHITMSRMTMEQKSKFAEIVCTSMRLLDEGVLLPSVSYDTMKEELLTLYNNTQNMEFRSFCISSTYGTLQDRLSAVRRIISRSDDMDFVLIETDTLLRSSRESESDDIVAFIHLIRNHRLEIGKPHTLIVMNGVAERFIA